MLTIQSAFISSTIRELVTESENSTDMVAEKAETQNEQIVALPQSQRSTSYL
jgi:hypothetical protein